MDRTTKMFLLWKSPVWLEFLKEIFLCFELLPNINNTIRKWNSAISNIKYIASSQIVGRVYKVCIVAVTINEKHSFVTFSWLSSSFDMDTNIYCIIKAVNFIVIVLFEYNLSLSDMHIIEIRTSQCLKKPSISLQRQININNVTQKCLFEISFSEI